MAVTSKLEIAAALLTESLRMFIEGKAYFAALHLAGAAEEIYGKFIEDEGGVPAFHSMRDTAVLFLRGEDGSECVPAEKAAKEMATLINGAKNTTKHGTTDVDFDAKEEAQDVIDRAIQNYYTLHRSWVCVRSIICINSKRSAIEENRS